MDTVDVQRGTEVDGVQIGNSREMMPILVIDCLSHGRAFSGTTGMSKAWLTAAAMNTPIAALTLSNQRLPRFVERSDFEPTGDGHGPTLEGEVIRFTTRDLNHLVDTVELKGLTESRLARREGDRCAAALRAIKDSSGILEILSVEIPVRLQAGF
ncbi:MAG: hypothetical protein JW395_3609 [Nitrospira sp.]|nr:hypothetical protein [Nitrospira sp.]